MSPNATDSMKSNLGEAGGRIVHIKAERPIRCTSGCRNCRWQHDP